MTQKPMSCNEKRILIVDEVDGCDFEKLTGPMFRAAFYEPIYCPAEKLLEEARASRADAIVMAFPKHPEGHATPRRVWSRIESDSELDRIPIVFLCSMADVVSEEESHRLVQIVRPFSGLEVLKAVVRVAPNEYAAILSERFGNKPPEPRD